MNACKKMNVTLDDFFDFLEESIKLDISSSTNTKVDTILSGYEYTKTLKNKIGQSGKVLSTIEKFERPHIYKLKVSSNQGLNFVTYTAKQIDACNIEVFYEEEFISSKKITNFNYKIVMHFYKKKTLQRMQAILTNIERCIKEKESESCHD